jgi:stage V sporulation protein AE
LRAKRQVIVITDGDDVALAAVEKAGRALGLRTISQSAGNPTRLSGNQIAELVKKAPYDPVLVMVDDRGKSYKYRGEKALEELYAHPDIEIVGAVAVASNTFAAEGTHVDASVTRSGEVVDGPVDKYGEPSGQPSGPDSILYGDTVDVLNEMRVPVVIGLGDLGKMDGADFPKKGCPRTIQAVREVLERNGLTVREVDR